MSPLISRGFGGRRRRDVDPSRIPPGQYVVNDFPVLSAGPTPTVPLTSGRSPSPAPSTSPHRGPGKSSCALPDEDVTTDIHCVTKWSKLDTTWRACPSTPCSRVSRPTADFVLAFCDGGYTTNLPLDDVTDGKAWVAYEYDGEPLEPEHGGPARLLVPHLYFWKSAKWVRGLQLIDRRRARVLGDQRLPQPRRPLAGAAVLGATEGDAARRRLAVATVRQSRPRRRARTTLDARRAGLAGPSRGPARRCPPDGRGRLPGRSVPTRSPPARGRAARAHGRAHRRRRGLALPDRRAPPGDQLELRGPIGGCFVWDAGDGGPLLLLGGGSGLVPLMAMLRHRAAATSTVGATVLVSARGWDDVLYRDELSSLDGDGVTIRYTLTRGNRQGGGDGRRANAEMLRELGADRAGNVRVFIAARPDSSSTSPTCSCSWDTTHTPSRPSASDRREADHGCVGHAHRRQRDRGAPPRRLRPRVHHYGTHVPVLRRPQHGRRPPRVRRCRHRPRGAPTATTLRCGSPSSPDRLVFELPGRLEHAAPRVRLRHRRMT